jgi:hypothetical protein
VQKPRQRRDLYPEAGDRCVKIRSRLGGVHGVLPVIKPPQGTGRGGAG